MIKGTEDTRYAYVNGIVRAKEARLLTRGHFDRLLAGDLSNFNTILSDSSYIAGKDIAAGLETEEDGLKDFFHQFCQTLEVSNLIDWPEQIHNLKVKLKEGGDELLYRQSESVVENWPEVIDEVARFTIEKDPFVLSTNLDIILCKYLYEAAEFVPFFNQYYVMYFDLENIRSFFRARQFENSKEIFTQVFIANGSVDKKKFIDNLSVHHDLLGKNFFTTPYAMIMDRGSAYIEGRHSFLRLERLCDEMRLKFLLQARRMTFGVEPLFSYYEFKMSEIKKLRQVYWGKLNEVYIDELKESIPDVW
jgi:vacuolar-type H+-ATPase subunit C/Vma6